MFAAIGMSLKGGDGSKKSGGVGDHTAVIRKRGNP
jgi:hypothetical protein